MSYINLDLNESISHPKSSVATKNDSITVEFYNENGVVDKSIKDDDKAAAVVYIYKNDKTYKVKATRAGEFFNPIKNDLKYGLEKRDRTTNTPLFRWKTVSSRSFNAYLKFLKERHDSLLFIAEREK